MRERERERRREERQRIEREREKDSCTGKGKGTTKVYIHHQVHEEAEEQSDRQKSGQCNTTLQQPCRHVKTIHTDSVPNMQNVMPVGAWHESHYETSQRRSVHFQNICLALRQSDE